MGHCYQYFTQLTALLSLTYLHKVLFHIKLGWGGGAPLLSPTYNPVVKCHMLNIAKVWGGGEYQNPENILLLQCLECYLQVAFQFL